MPPINHKATLVGSGTGDEPNSSFETGDMADA
jgi:hypothetical protein